MVCSAARCGRHYSVSLVLVLMWLIAREGIKPCYRGLASQLRSTCLHKARHHIQNVDKWAQGSSRLGFMSSIAYLEDLLCTLANDSQLRSVVQSHTATACA